MPTYNTPFNGPTGHVGIAERRRICETVVGLVEWSEHAGWGYCACPGMQFHTGKDGRRDCRVYAEETTGAGRGGAALPPGVTCLHTSCASAIEEASKRIRSLIGKAKVEAGRGMPRADTRVRGPAPTRDTVAQNPQPRTVRTPVFNFSEKGKTNSRTLRTDISRPYALHAHVPAHTHEPKRTQELPSDPSTAPAPKQQPKAQPRQAEASGMVFHPIRLVWITREEWAEDLRQNPLKPI